MTTVFVVSDATGATAERTLKAALTQFDKNTVNIEIRSYIRTEDQVRTVIEEAVDIHGFVIHTLVSDELRAVITQEGRMNDVETIDLMGPLLDRLSRQFAISPSEKPGLFHQLNEDYFRRIETMEFAMRHDDGLHPDELEQAEIVLVGVSRTFKTPITMYLAFKGWLAANVPIILSVEPPEILFQLPPERVFGLTMDTRRLSALRTAREGQFGSISTDYADLDYVRKEVTYALKIFERPPQWPVINVTAKPIEEIASEILALSRDVKSSHSGSIF